MAGSASACHRPRSASEIGPKARRLRSSSMPRSSCGPSSRIVMWPTRSTELLHDVIGHGVVRVHVLDVVGILKRLDQPEHPSGLILIQLDLDRGQERGLRGLVFDPRLLQRGAHRHQVARLADHLERLTKIVILLGARVQHRPEHVVLGHPGRLGHDHDTLAVEHVRHRSGVRHGTPVAGQGGPHVGGPLVVDRLVGGPAGFEPGAAADRPVDVVAGDRVLPRLLHRVVERGIPAQVGATGPGRDLHVLDQLGEQLAAPGIDDRLLVLGRSPLRVAAHERSLTMSTKSLWTRRSPVSSGWNAVAIAGPWRTATILPVAGSVPRISTCPPVSSTHGALMNTARNAEPGTPASVISLSNEATWRPEAVRRTVMSIPPNASCPLMPSPSRSASMIMPAQEPNVGIPPLIRLRSGSIRSKMTASFHIVVDSPPGMIRPSTASSSSGLRTGTGRAPTAASADTCSDTSPCSASTPTTGASGVTGMAILLVARVSLRG